MLLIAYGNPGRGDDGLGPEFARRLSESGRQGIKIVTDFQLKPEHAVAIATASSVVFVDASLTAPPPFAFDPLEPEERGEVNSHRIAPVTVLALARLHFGATCPAYLLAISGTCFEHLHDGLSPEAQANLAKAEAFFHTWRETQHPVLAQ
ncbi:hydrogenase maturation protease [Ovoidimarina sediminis]|uniref:hydrogenase maturation protease n=1 Tax=Ovoidimarina sediminis TaxID=3079856 RepID=UPI00290B2558|nr:hydrogenase maturation protease [Rhodophyticola sp. MJ-SS7]MDU8943733.1 hydrogenase maturation protease [Rhodophyticola sp. MJ-SS7]